MDRSASWQAWHGVAIAALVVWVLARRGRIWIVDTAKEMAWHAHGAVAAVPQVTADAVRPVVDWFVALWPAVAVGCFLGGFVAFHRRAERERRERLE
jgi:hypothetical protein